MKRKVNRVGQNTLTVSLPTKWAKKQDLSAGDEVEVNVQGNNLLIGTLKKGGILKKKVEIQLDDFNKIMVNRYLHELYRQGVEEIELRFTKKTLPDYKKGLDIDVIDHVKDIVKRLIGMEIISQTENRITIKTLITKEQEEDADAIQHRIYYLIKEFSNEFIKSTDGDFNSFHETISDYHDNIVKFIYYYLRLINFSDISESKKSRLVGLYMVIDKVIDKFRHASDRVNEMKKITPQTKEIIKEMFDFLLEHFSMIFKKEFSLKDIDHIIKKRYEIIKRIQEGKFEVDEYKAISELNVILTVTNDFAETYVAMNF